MINSLKKILCGLPFILVALAGSGLTWAEEPTVTPKAVTVRDAGDTQNSQNSLTLNVRTLRDSFAPEEPIRFQVRANRDFYLYVYNVDKDGEARLLVPSRRYPENLYRGGRDHRVPESGVEFVSDRAGRERFVVVASSRYIDLSTARNRFKDADNFGTAKESVLEEMFQEKGVRVREIRSGQATERDLAVRDLEVRIAGEGWGKRYGVDRRDEAVAFVNSNQERYHEGERMHIVFGANRSGWVTLFSIAPDGAINRLTSEKVNGERVNTLSARAELPAGRHTLAAVYSRDGRVDRAALEDAAEATKSLEHITAKDIVLDRQRNLPVATREIRIER